MITEHEIDLCVEKFSSDEEKMTLSFIGDNQDFLSYIKSEINPLLKEEERKVFLFISTIVFHSFLINENYSAEFNQDIFDSKDEENWGFRDKQTSFDKTKDIYFENYGQEDLLAFVEDILTDEEEENSYSDAGKEIVFINCKSYIDTLSESNINHS